jgi:hypothetical protein
MTPVWNGPRGNRSLIVETQEETEALRENTETRGRNAELMIVVTEGTEAQMTELLHVMVARDREKTEGMIPNRQGDMSEDQKKGDKDARALLLALKDTLTATGPPVQSGGETNPTVQVEEGKTN